MQVFSVPDCEIAMNELDKRLDVMERWMWHRRLYLYLVSLKKRFLG